MTQTGTEAKRTKLKVNNCETNSSNLIDDSLQVKETKKLKSAGNVWGATALKIAEDVMFV